MKKFADLRLVFEKISLVRQLPQDQWNVYSLSTSGLFIWPHMGNRLGYCE